LITITLSVVTLKIYLFENRSKIRFSGGKSSAVIHPSPIPLQLRYGPEGSGKSSRRFGYQTEKWNASYRIKA